MSKKKTIADFISEVAQTNPELGVKLIQKANAIRKDSSESLKEYEKLQSIITLHLAIELLKKPLEDKIQELITSLQEDTFNKPYVADLGVTITVAKKAVSDVKLKSGVTNEDLFKNNFPFVKEEIKTIYSLDKKTIAEQRTHQEVADLIAAGNLTITDSSEITVKLDYKE